MNLYEFLSRLSWVTLGVLIGAAAVAYFGGVGLWQ
jgi:hypothetical protein